MSCFQFFTFRLGGFSIIFLSLSSAILYGSELYMQRQRQYGDKSNGSLSSAERFLNILSYGSYVSAYYSLVCHILVILVPLRTCWAMVFFIRRSLKHRNRTHKSESDGTFSPRIVSAQDTAGTEKATESPNTCQVYHVIIIPNYTEDIVSLRETLQVLASHPQACLEYHVSVLSRPLCMPSHLII